MKPLIFVIFGASGDLTFRKLIPALYTLYLSNLLPKKFKIIGFARRGWNDSEFIHHIENNIDFSSFRKENRWNEFSSHLEFITSDFSDKSGYEDLSEKILKSEKDFGENSLKTFYLSTAPEFFLPIAENIKHSKINKICSKDEFSRVIVEKPYGIDLKNTIEIDNVLQSIFAEEHIYRIDHYLGKESVQNILAFRFANSVFERLWNKDNIEYIQIKVDEDLGIGDRGLYFDQTGVIKDMVQNHVLQILSTVTMSAPKTIQAKDIQKQRLEILKNLKIEKGSIIRGQYESYKTEKNIKPQSNTETFVSLKIYIDLPQWKNVPIYIRTGKKMKKKISEISVKFRDKDLNVYDKMSGTNNDILTFRIQPDEGISLTLLAKEPGQSNKLVPVSLDFCYRPTFSQPVLDSYVGLIQSVIEGKQSIFTSIDEIKAQWQFMECIKKEIGKELFEYMDGENGPLESEKFLEKEGKEWYENDQYVCAVRV